MDLFRLMAAFVILSGTQYLGMKFVNFMDVIASSAVKMETAQIAEMVYLDTLDNTAPDASHFSEYLQRNMVTKIRNRRDSRDYSKDYWGIPYQLEIHGGRITVTSAGPDMIFGTDDDIVSGFETPGGTPPPKIIDPLKEFKDPFLNPPVPQSFVAQSGLDPRILGNAVKSRQAANSRPAAVKRADAKAGPVRRVASLPVRKGQFFKHGNMAAPRARLRTVAARTAPRKIAPAAPNAPRKIAMAARVTMPRAPRVIAYEDSFEARFAYQVSSIMGWIRSRCQMITNAIFQDEPYVPQPHPQPRPQQRIVAEFTFPGRR